MNLFGNNLSEDDLPYSKRLGFIKKKSSTYNYLLQDIFPLFPGLQHHLDTLDILEVLDILGTLDILEILEILDIVDTVFLLIQQDWTLFGSYHTRQKPCQCLPRKFSKISAICVQIMYLLIFDAVLFLTVACLQF